MLAGSHETSLENMLVVFKFEAEHTIGSFLWLK